MHESESEVTQSCLTPSDPMDCSLPGSSVHGICQTRVLEWVAIAFSELFPKLPQFQELASKQWEQIDSGAENELYLKQPGWRWSDHRRTNLKMVVGADCVVSACNPLCLLVHPWNSPLKAFAHWLSVGRSQPLTQVCPPHQLEVSGNKANFPFQQSCLFIGFWAASSWTPLSIALAQRFPGWPWLSSAG